MIKFDLNPKFSIKWWPGFIGNTNLSLFSSFPSFSHFTQLLMFNTSIFLSSIAGQICTVLFRQFITIRILISFHLLLLLFLTYWLPHLLDGTIAINSYNLPICPVIVSSLPKLFISVCGIILMSHLELFGSLLLTISLHYLVLIGGWGDQMWSMFHSSITSLYILILFLNYLRYRISKDSCAYQPAQVRLSSLSLSPALVTIVRGSQLEIVHM